MSGHQIGSTDETELSQIIKIQASGAELRLCRVFDKKVILKNGGKLLCYSIGNDFISDILSCNIWQTNSNIVLHSFLKKEFFQGKSLSYVIKTINHF